MKLTPQDTKNLLSVLTACAVGGIESIIIEDGIARGANEARTFAILTTDSDVPKLPQKMGLGSDKAARLSSLRQRLELFGGDTSTIIDAKETERGEISSLDITSGKNKVQFRCTSAMLIKAPKSINDVPTFKLFVTRPELKMILNSIKIMGGKTVQIIIKKDRTAQIIAVDEANDPFTTALETPVEILTGDEQDSVVHYYHGDIFHSTLRAQADVDVITFDVGSSGTIRAKIHGHSVVVMPKIPENSDEEE